MYNKGITFLCWDILVYEGSLKRETPRTCVTEAFCPALAIFYHNSGFFTENGMEMQSKDGTDAGTGSPPGWQVPGIIRK